VYDITSIGTATVDTFLELSDIVYQSLITSEGKQRNYYCLELGSKVPVKNLEEYLGGNALNTAVSFSLLGLQTTIITSLGFSPWSKFIINSLKTQEIETKFIKLDAKVDINLSYILDWHKDKSDRIILTYHRPKSFKKIKFPQTKWFYIASLAEYFEEVIKQLPSSPKIAFNPGYELKLGMKKLLPFFRRTEILILNKQEAVSLLGFEQQGADYNFLLTNLLKLGPRTVVITDGRYGAWAKNRNEQKEFFEPSIEVEVKEVTGAGDAFASAFVTAYIKEQNLQDCLRWGILNSTSCIQKIGAQNGLLTAAVLKKRYKEAYC
jgi:ribokinase